MASPIWPTASSIPVAAVCRCSGITSNPKPSMLITPNYRADCPSRRGAAVMLCVQVAHFPIAFGPTEKSLGRIPNETDWTELDDLGHHWTPVAGPDYAA